MTFTTENDIGDDFDGLLDSSGSGFFTAGCVDDILTSSTSIAATGSCEFGITSSGNPVSTDNDTDEVDGMASNLSDCASQCDQVSICHSNWVLHH